MRISDWSSDVCSSDLVALEDLAAEMRPAGDLLDAISLIKLLISGIAVGLEKAGERPELALRMDATAIWREPIPGERRGGGTRCAVIDDISPEPRLRGDRKSTRLNSSH